MQVPPRAGESLNWSAVARGTLIGFAMSAVLSGVIEVLRHFVHGFADSGGESAVALLAIGCYLLGGYYAVGSATASSVVSGALAGVGVACLGLALSVVIWIARDNGPFLTGKRADHPALVLIGPVVFGCFFGALGGAWAKRHRQAA